MLCKNAELQRWLHKSSWLAFLVCMLHLSGCATPDQQVIELDDYDLTRPALRRQSEAGRKAARDNSESYRKLLATRDYSGVKEWLIRDIQLYEEILKEWQADLDEWEDKQRDAEREDMTLVYYDSVKKNHSSDIRDIRSFLARLYTARRLADDAIRITEERRSWNEATEKLKSIEEELSEKDAEEARSEYDNIVSDQSLVTILNKYKPGWKAIENRITRLEQQLDADRRAKEHEDILAARRQEEEQRRLVEAEAIARAAAAPKVKWLKPSYSEVREARITVEATIESSQPLGGVELLINGRSVAKHQSAAKGVTVEPSGGGQPDSVRIDRSEKGAAIHGEITLDAGRNVIEVHCLGDSGPISKDLFIITHLGTDVSRKPIGQRWAVLVGIDDYKDTGHGVPNLRFAAKDAQAVHDFLRSDQGGSFPSDNIRVLLNERATSAAVREAIFDFLAEAQEDDFVVIYFSCHGAPAPGRPDNLYIITHDTDPEKMASTALPMWEIQTALTRHIRAERVLVLTDACHSAGVGGIAGARSGETNLINKFVQQLAETKPGRAIFTASEANEQGFEGEEYGGGHGAFTHFLLEGLGGAADEDDDGTVTLGEAVDYTSEKVRRATKGKQHPDTAGKFDRDIPLSVLR